MSDMTHDYERLTLHFRLKNANFPEAGMPVVHIIMLDTSDQVQLTSVIVVND